MQINFRMLPVFTLALLTTFTACKKDSKPAASDAELTTQADDQNRVSSQIDIVANDVTAAIESSASFSGRVQNPPAVSCDATVTFDSVSNPRKVTINYNGSCNGGYTRNGTVMVSMPANLRWKDQGATITLSYQNLKITRKTDSKSITINGSQTITNVSGGLLYNLPNLPSITHTVSSSGMSITFDDNTQRNWQIATRRVFVFNNGVIILTVTGNNTVGANGGIAVWGVNRFGKDFTTSITQPLVIRSDCAFRLTAGEVKHEGFGTATASFGLDAMGNPTPCPATGNYYFKLTWTGSNGKTVSAILPY